MNCDVGQCETCGVLFAGKDKNKECPSCKRINLKAGCLGILVAAIVMAAMVCMLGCVAIEEGGKQAASNEESFTLFAVASIIVYTIFRLLRK